MDFVHRWKSRQFSLTFLPFGNLFSIFCPHRKDSLESSIVTYMDLQTFIGKCPGYYFKKCLQSKNVIKTRLHLEIVRHSTLVRKCCYGYLDYDGECLPYCMSGCLNGNCTGPNHCTCYDGYEEDEFNR